MKIKFTKSIKETASDLQSTGSEKLSAFRQFIFAPNLLTFVISVVVGNSFGSTVKDLISTAFGFMKMLTMWLFNSGHHLNINYVASPLESLLDSLLTLLFIAIVVFYTIQFINNYLLDSNESKWGFNQAHEDSLKIQELQEQNNMLMNENIELQRGLLEELRKNK